MTTTDPATAVALDEIPVRPDRLDELFATLRGYLHLKAVDHVLFALATAVAARIDGGDPLWGMIIGPPSSGKTEAVRMLDAMADEHPDEITAPSLLSLSKGKEPKPVGILTRMPNPAFLTVADFSTVLATSDRGSRDQLFALLRRAYDGDVSRDIGNSPRPLTWHGRLTLLAACTPIIDSYSSHADAKRATGRKVLQAGMLAEHRARAADLAAAIVRSALGRVPKALSEDVGEHIINAALVACQGRAAVERDGYGRREISSTVVEEEPARLVGQLALLARSLLALGLDTDQAVALCRRCALDSIPEARRRALAVLARGEATVSEVHRLTGCHRHVARMALEELDAIGVAMCDDPEDSEPGAPRPWSLTAPYDQLIRRVFSEHDKAKGLARKVGSNTTTPPIKGEGIGTFHFSCQPPEPDEEDRDVSLDKLDAYERDRAADPLESVLEEPT